MLYFVTNSINSKYGVNAAKVLTLGTERYQYSSQTYFTFQVKCVFHEIMQKLYFIVNEF